MRFLAKIRDHFLPLLIQLFLFAGVSHLLLQGLFLSLDRGVDILWLEGFLHHPIFR